MAGKVKTPKGYMVPAKYVAGLTGEQRRKRLQELDRMREKGRVLGPLSGDKTPSGKKKTLPKSPYTKRYEERYGKAKSKH